jgi:DNA invertase Pin-like site-specific DNA recombinase
MHPDSEKRLVRMAQMPSSTEREIAKAFNISTQAVGRILKKHGVKIRSDWRLTEKRSDGH